MSHSVGTLAQAIFANTAAAGPLFDYAPAAAAGIKHSRPAGGKDMQGLRAWLWLAQDGICAACGDDVAISDGDVAHVVSNKGTPSKCGGYLRTGSNLYFAHPLCNKDDEVAYGDVVPATGFVRADLVPITYPSRKDMRAAADTLAGRVSAATGAQRAERLARRLALRAAGSAIA